MISRRQFGYGATALGLFRSSFADGTTDEKVFRFTNPNGAMDATQCWQTCGQDPRLGYYAMEGVREVQIPVNNLNQAMIALVQGQSDFSVLVPPLYLPAISQDPNLGIIGIYNLFPHNFGTVVVPADSDIKSVAELAGKRIGVRSLGDGSDATIKILFADLGMTSATYQLISVGDVGLAASALKRNDVDAICTYDTVAGRIEALGVTIRYLPLTKTFTGGSANWFGVSKTTLEQNRKQIIGILRANAKSTLFAYYNMNAAIQIHWALYPDSKPKTKSEKDALHDLNIILKNRREAWVRNPNDPEQRMGVTTSNDWSSAKKFGSVKSTKPGMVEDLIGDEVYTNELIDEINDFNRPEIIEQARNFKIQPL
jgi:NitT/TauT family transport system substrate-binding protein